LRVKTRRRQFDDFCGQYDTHLLVDGRIALPVEVIRQLRDAGIEKVRVGIIPNRQALVVCPEVRWDTWLYDLRQRFPFLNTPDGFMVFVSLSRLCEIDDQGRIYVPARLRRHLGDIRGHEVVIVGVMDHFEVWPREAFDDIVRKCRDTLLRSSLPEPCPLEPGTPQYSKNAPHPPEEHSEATGVPRAPSAKTDFPQDAPFPPIKYLRSPDAQPRPACNHECVVKKQLMSQGVKQNRKSQSQAEEAQKAGHKIPRPR